VVIGLIPTCLFSISCAVRDILTSKQENADGSGGGARRGGNIPCLSKAVKKLEEVGTSAVKALEESYPSGTVPQVDKGGERK
jgi:hypothetical protein